MAFRKIFVLVALLSALVHAQYVPVHATLNDGSGAASKTGFLHFELQNCGANFPTVVGNASIVVQPAFDIKPNQPDGSILGQVVPNDIILCGNITSTLWKVTPMKNSSQPLTPSGGKLYQICSLALTCYPSGGTWEFAIAEPKGSLFTAPTGSPYSMLIANPIWSQTWNQPPNTSAFFLGTFDFTHATVLGIGGGGGNGNGTITGITAGAGLEGGGTSGNVTLDIPAAGVTNTMLQNNSVTVNTGTGLAGGGTVALGGTLNLTNTVTGTIPPGITFANTLQYWSQQQTSTSLTGGTPSSVTLPAGIDGIDVTGLFGYQVLLCNVFTVGNPTQCNDANGEIVVVTGGTYTKASGGTILFTPFISHTAPYYVGSSTNGIQEGLNVCVGLSSTYYHNGNCNFTIPANGSEPSVTGGPYAVNTYWVYGTIHLNGAHITLTGPGATLYCAGRGACIQNGLPVNTNWFSNNTIRDLGVQTPYAFTDVAYKGSQVTNTSCGSGYCTITTSAAHHFRPGDMVTVEFTDDPVYVDDHVIVDCGSGSSAGTCDGNSATFRYASALTVASQATPGTVALAFVAVLDSGEGTNIDGVFVPYGGALADFSNYFDIWNDQQLTISNFSNNGAALQANANWTGAFVFSSGPSNAPVISIKNSTITGNGSNGVTVYNSNGLYVENTVIQAAGLWQIHSSNMRGNFQGASAINVYGEANPLNPLSPAKTPFPGTGSAGLLAGLSSGSAHFEFRGIHGPGGFFTTSGTGGPLIAYFVVANDVTAGTHTSPMLAAKYLGTTAFNLTWPRVANGTHVITYDVIQYTSPGVNAGFGVQFPSPGNCTGGSGAGSCGSVTGGTNIAQCAGLVCSLSVTPGSVASYPVNVGTYAGQIHFWPGTLVSVNKPIHTDHDQTDGTGIGLNNAPLQIAAECPNFGAVSAGGYTECLTAATSPNNAVTSGNGTIIADGPGSAGSMANLKGRLNISNTPGTTVSPTEVITILDSESGKTRGTYGNRPPASANDTFIGIDVPVNVAQNLGQLAFNSPVAVSNYIGSVLDNTSWKERLTSISKSLKVPLDMLGAAGPPASPAANYCRQYYDITAGQVGWINSVGGSCGPSASAFASLSGGTSTQTFLMGTGGSLSYTGTGTVNANSLLGSPIPAVTTGNLCWTGGALSWCPAGTGTVTSVGIVGTVNQITVTGTSPITGAGTLTLSLPAALSITALTASGTITGNVTGNLTGTASNAIGLMGSSIPTLAVGDLCWTGTALSWCAASGSGTVTTFSAGNLSPLFTTSVTNPTSAPALAFSLSNAPAFSLLGNNTGSSAAPGYNYTVGSTGNSIPQLNSGLLLASIIPVATNVAIGGVKPDGTSILNAAGVLSATPASIGADVSGAAATAQTAAQTFATAAVATETSRATTAEGLLVPKTTTVNGHALSANVTVSASDLTTGTLPHAQLPTLVSGDIPNNAANTSGLAATASALGSTPTLCNTGFSAGGILANGNATNCIASTITYPFQAPVGDSTHPQYTFVVDTLTGIYNAPEGDQQAVTQVVVASGTATATILSPVNSLSWATNQTFTFTSLPSPITSMNAVQYVISSVSGSRPTSTVTFNCPLQCGVAGQAPVGTYASTAGAYGKVYGGGFAGHQWIFDRLQSSTNNTAQTGSVQFARRDAVKTRSGPIDVTGHDLSLIRGGTQFSPTNSPSTMLMTVNGAVTGGATSISIARAAGANWSAVAGDPLVIQLIPADKPAGIAGDADLQFYTITSNVTVTGGTNTTVSISPAVPALGLAGGEVISPYYIRAQLGDATGVQVLGDLHVFGSVFGGESCPTCAGEADWSFGTPQTQAANSVGFGAPASGTAYKMVLPGAVGTSGQGLQISSVASGIATLQWSTPSAGATWGAITGTLSSQTDLNTALNGKEPVLTGTGLARNTGTSTELSGDVTTSGSNAVTLATVNAGPGSCGDATHVCQVTTDGKGRVTSQSATAITAGGPAVGSRPQQVQWGWQAGSSVGSSTVLYGPFPFSIATSIPTNDSDSTGQGYFALNTAPAATWVVTVYKIPAGGAACSGTPASIGTISISTSNIATFSLTATSFVKGDCWEFVAPSGVDTNAPIPASVGIYVLD